MTTATPSKSTGENSAPAKTTAETAPKRNDLVTDQGSTTIADVVVQKVAGLAAREVRGVHALGGGAARAFSAIRDRIPGASASIGQGVSVEVGETQAAVDLEIVVEYGVAIAELARTVRRNVITAIEQMTGLEVVEVNIHVNDVHIPGDDEDETDAAPSRVR
ncbi:Asp23/Gls24 family envelope stress response protein [Nocardia farcinica]|uniref:Alkaline shock protein 23 n=1 Tax=Nocardia farcinica TaxID=37329 RepID=A0A0H5P1E3_NOCFR|nr:MULTISPECIES: Asp23/Gls24 family envelope stress response protein [Nocardia]AXK85118.1 Asp23/Gls24 family envelope stress response protein [Nocardia farcinica]MBA4855529.1 Asp23/Gls24 family envelope stress response protein [Nocardia farcinica]MBC9818132.1 Asp23/Gls24 family envelope stress response protein [Nocardia farcinica]MBF6067825.1 Asp23/Gls24 family envelope stress response protein [Nocardia farcinica]MBF6140325.1 Asp23/Gls24 family envelope stress response protein [Nocardia farcin